MLASYYFTEDRQLNAFCVQLWAEINVHTTTELPVHETVIIYSNDIDIARSLYEGVNQPL